MNPHGEYGEQAARRFLEKKGFRHAESNFATRWGEIDLIMADDDTVVFVEVKHRRGAEFGGGEEAITWSKMKHIERVAMIYIQQKRIHNHPMRFDVVVIGPEGIHHYQNAFMASGEFY